MAFRNLSITCLFILNTFLLLNAQTGIGYIFNNRDDAYPENPDSGIKPLYWNNGVLYLGFFVDEETDSYGISLIFYDTLGNLEWQKRHYSSNHVVYSGYDLLALNNSAFYIGGAIRETWDSQYKSMLIKFNNQGDTVFSIVYPDSANKAINCMERYSNDTILLCSKWDDDLSGDQKIIIEKIDTNGTIYSTNVSDYNNWNPEQIIITPYDEIYVGGERKTESNNIKIFINVYDLNLNFKYTVNPSQTINEYFSSFNIMDNKVYMTARVTAYNPWPTWEQCKVTRLSPNSGGGGSALIGEMFNSVGVGNAITLNNNCMIVPISSFSLPNVHNLYFVDTNFNVTCSTYINISSVPYNMKLFGKIALVSGNKIAGTGYILADPNDPHLTQDHWNYLTTDVNEFIEMNCNNFTTEINSFDISTGVLENFKIYPNPFQSKLYIDLISDLNKPYEVRLFNFDGSLKLFKKASSDVILDLNLLSNGIYFLNIITENQVINHKLIKN